MFYVVYGRRPVGMVDLSLLILAESVSPACAVWSSACSLCQQRWRFVALEWPR